MKEYVLFFKKLFSLMDRKQVNRLMEALIESRTLDARNLTAAALKQYKDVEPDWEKIISVFSRFSEEESDISITTLNLNVSKKMMTFLTKLQRVQDISHLIVLNNMFSKDHNNN